jgi:hypothetical protein
VARALSPDDVSELAACGETLECARTLIGNLGRRVFRRPVSDAEVASFEATFVDGPGADDFVLGARLTVLAMLQSASFLYRPEFGTGEGGAGEVELAPHEVASRLSYFVWGSMPDDELLEAAANGELGTAEAVGRQAERLLADPRARQGLSQFFREWLHLSKVVSVDKLAEDAWTPEFREELAESAVRFVYDEVFKSGASAELLLTSNQYPATSRIAELLGVAATSGEDWQLVSADPERRAGLLTHPAFLGAYGYGDFPSPVLRGVFIMDRILCAPPAPPPPGVDTSLPDSSDEEVTESRTNREA